MRGLPAFRTSGFVVYTKVALWSSKSEHGTPIGGGTLDYMLSIDRLLSGFVSLIRVCHSSSAPDETVGIQLHERGRSLRTEKNVRVIRFGFRLCA